MTLVDKNSLCHQTYELFFWNLFGRNNYKIPSDMEVTLRYELLSLLSLFTKFTLLDFYTALQQKAFKCTNKYYGFIALCATEQKVEVDWVILL